MTNENIRNPWLAGLTPNGKGRVRTVTALLPDYRLYQWMKSNADCVEFEVIHGDEMPEHAGENLPKMTVAAFARWAKERIS